MTVVSAASLCHVTVSPSELASDRLLELVLLRLVPSLQVKVQQVEKAHLSMTLSNQVLYQRNVVLKTLVGLIGVKYGGSGCPLLSHPSTPISTSALTGWMSIADSVKQMDTADDLLTNLDSHLETYSFLLPTSHTASLADLDLAIQLIEKWSDHCKLHRHVCRWLNTCQTILVQLGCRGIAKPKTGNLASPAFFYGTQDNSFDEPRQEKTVKPNQVQMAAKQQGVSKSQAKKKSGKDKPEKPVQSQPASTAESPEFCVSALDIRVGKILKAWHHPEADKLFCEEIDVGGGEVRQIASGLRPFYQTADLEGRDVVVLCNLKKRSLVGFSSHGMVLCASNSNHTVVKFVSPPHGSKPGDRIVFGELKGEPEPESKIAKKKIFERIAVDLKTDEQGQVVWKKHLAKVKDGTVTAELQGGSVS